MGHPVYANQGSLFHISSLFFTIVLKFWSKPEAMYKFPKCTQYNQCVSENSNVNPSIEISPLQCCSLTLATHDVWLIRMRNTVNNQCIWAFISELHANRGKLYIISDTHHWTVCTWENCAVRAPVFGSRHQFFGTWEDHGNGSLL